MLLKWDVLGLNHSFAGIIEVSSSEGYQKIKRESVCKTCSTELDTQSVLVIIVYPLWSHHLEYSLKSGHLVSFSQNGSWLTPLMKILRIIQLDIDGLDHWTDPSISSLFCFVSSIWSLLIWLLLSLPRSFKLNFCLSHYVD